MRKLLLLAAALTLLQHQAAAAQPPEDWAQAVANHDMLFSASSSSADLLPVITNGYLGWTIDSPHVYLSGLFSRNDTTVPVPGVYRTRLPSQLSIVPQAAATRAAAAGGGGNIDVEFIGAALDLKTGSFLRRYHFRRPLDGAIIEVEQRWYAHRAFRSILAMTLTATTYSSSSSGNRALDPPFELQLVTVQRNQGADDGEEENDVLFEDLSSHYPGLRVLRGKQFQAENATAPTIIISLVSTPIPPSLTITGNQTWQFVTSIRTTTTTADVTIPSSPPPEQAALNDHRLAKSMASSPELFSLHKDEWKNLWVANGIEIGLSSPSPSSSSSSFSSSSSSWLPAAVNTSFSILSSSLRADFPYGIARGGLTPAYGGHTFWDAEMWIFPSLLLSAPALAESLVRYRFERLEMAVENAKKQKGGGGSSGYEGALFPWESAGTGEEGEGATTDTDTHTHTDKDGRAVHVSGSVALAVWQYWLATNDIKWLQEVGFPLLESVADFWVSRAEVVEEVDEKQQTRTQAHIRGVIPPDAFAGVVDDSVYTNVVARESLRYASRAAAILLQHAAAATARGGGAKENISNNGKNKSPLLLLPITRTTTTMLALNDTDTHTHTHPTPLQSSIDKWSTLHDQLVILYNHTQGIHPEHQNYSGANIEQSDVILLGYPWQFYSSTNTHTHTHTQTPGTDQETRKRDFMYYKDKLVYFPSSPPSPPSSAASSSKSRLLGARTWSMQAINALDLGLEKEAYHAFLQSYQPYCQVPFGVWTEEEEEEEGGKDVFVTAEGGFLQVLIQGYGGFRLLEETEQEEEGGGGGNTNNNNNNTTIPSSLLHFSPQCPPGVKSMKFRHLTFLGNHFALSYTCGDVADGPGDKMTFSLGRREPGAPSLQLVLHKGGKEKGKKEEHFPLFVGQVLTVPRQEAWLVNVGEDKEGGVREEKDG